MTNNDAKDIAKLSLKSYHTHTDSHSHQFHQLVLPVKGVLDLEIGGCGGQVSASHGALICASEQHAFCGTDDNQFIVADIPLQLAPAFAKLPVFLRLDDNINHYIRFLNTQLQLPTARTSQLLQRQMLLLLVQLLDEKHSTSSDSDNRLLRARNFFEQHFSDKNVMSAAASHAALSPRHLRQLFALHYDMSPSQYLLELRMQAAWQLLAKTKVSVQVIAQRCGYSNLSAFSDRFHKHFGTSPSQIRK